MRLRNVCVMLFGAAVAALVASPGAAAQPRPPMTIAIVDFDYSDTSGEARDQRDDHERRRRDFMTELRRDLAESGVFKVVDIDCGADPCSGRATPPARLFEVANKAGARLLLYGGLHKMSTLVQWGRMQMVDVDSNLLVDDRHLTFRGDDDNAWRRAREYLAKRLIERAAALRP